MPKRSLCVVTNRPSESAKSLATSLGVKRVKIDRTALRKYRRLLNWGCTDENRYENWINDPSAVADATDKARAFLRFGMNNVPIPRVTRSIEEARTFGGIVLCRSRRGSSGRGITVARSPDEIVEAEIYVQYVPKLYEYRVHVVDREVIFIQQKRRRGSSEMSRDEKLIRNHGNGWVFAENSVEFPSEEVKQSTIEACIRAVDALGLDFGAVDVILSRESNSPVVLEVNTAPGIESSELLSRYTSTLSEAVVRSQAA